MVSIEDKIQLKNKEELAEIWCNLNCYEWDERLGDKPEGFDDYPDRDKMNPLMTKRRFIRPIMHKIEEKTTPFERSRAWHLYRLKNTKIEFYRYWFKRLYRVHIQGEVI